MTSRAPDIASSRACGGSSQYLPDRRCSGSFAALRATFASVDKVGNLYVFNIGGNKYRLIASVAFVVRTVWVKAVLTHAEYDKGKWE